jgi:hypothetical protein
VAKWLERRSAKRLCAIAGLSFLAGCGGGGGGGGASCSPPPRISSSPPQIATVGSRYVYVADSSVSCIPFFTACSGIVLLQAPPGASLSGRSIFWTPSPGEGRTNVPFKIATVQDLCGDRATQSWTVSVSPVSTIQSFGASPSFVLPGETVTVTAIFEGTGQIQGIGAVTSGVPVTVGPINGPTQLTLVVQSPFGDTWTSTATISLLTPPTIREFSANPATIGYGSFTTLSWWIDGQLESARIDPVNASGLASNSALTVGPLYTDTTYVLTASNRAGSTTRTVEIIVLPPSSIDEFSASATSTTLGGEVTFTARFVGSGELLKENDRGGMDSFATLASGDSLNSGPLYRNTRFTLRVSGGTTVTQDIRVSVTGPGTFESLPQPSEQVQDAVVLPDGRVFFTSQQRAYYFDPATRQFSSGAALTQFPTRFLTLLTNGRVMMVSPFVNIGCSLAQIYDPANDSYRSTGNLGCLPGIPVQAMTLRDGRVLVRADPRFPGDVPGITIWDGQMFASSVTPRPALAGTRGVLLADGRVLFPRPSGSEIFTPGADVFSTSTASFADRGPNDSRVNLPDGRLFIGGGAININQPAELYDPNADSVALGFSQDTPNLHGQGAALLASGKVLIAGGSGYATSLIFDPATRLFTRTGGLQTPRYFALARTLNDGRVLVLGGCGFTPCDAEIYTPP